MGKANELTFQNELIKQLVPNGWLVGKPENYNRELALYSDDLLSFVKETQDEQWQKSCMLSALISAAVTGKVALAHPCARDISASLHVIDVRNWLVPEPSNNKNNKEVGA